MSVAANFDPGVARTMSQTGRTTSTRTLVWAAALFVAAGAGLLLMRTDAFVVAGLVSIGIGAWLFAAFLQRTDAGEAPSATGTSQKWNKRRMLIVAGIAGVTIGIALLIGGILATQSALTLLGAVTAATGAAWLVCAHWTSADALRAADLRYIRGFFPAMAAYVLIMVLIWPLAARMQNVPARVAIALLPVVPVAFLARSMVRLIRDSDELERRVQLEAICIASLVVGMLSFAAGFLQAAGLLPLKGGLMLVLPALFAVYGVASWWARRRYRE